MPRTLLRSCAWVLSLLVGAWLLVIPVYATVRGAAPITVTTTADTIADDTCSLRAAIIAANTDSAVGGCPGGSGADTIHFDVALPQPAIFTLTHSGAEENAAQNGDLDIAGVLTISAAAVANTPTVIVIDGNGSDRVFEILTGARVTMTGVTIRNGNPGEASDGGGVLVGLTARLTLTSSQIISNSALIGGGVKVLGRLTMSDSTVADNQGGGISNTGGLVTLHNVQISNNRGGYGFWQSQGALTFTTGLIEANQGGGIYNAAGTATLTRVNILHNTDGGGAVNLGASLTRLTIAHSLILSNTATTGAGIFNEGVGASVDIYDTRISGNYATSSGGGLFNNGIMTVHGSTVDHNQAGAGAGLHHFGGNLSLRNDTFSQNSAGDNGGGLYNGSSAVLNAVTFTENRANGEGGNLFNDEAQLSIENSIVAHAQDGDNCVKSGGFLTSLGHNLESANHCNFTATGDITNTNPLLGPLQGNGGTTLTQALLVGSPAIDQGAATCPATDQRGVARPQGAACDIGAYEFASSADLAITAGVTPTAIAVGERMTYTLFIRNQGPLVADRLVLSDTLPNGATLITATISGGLCGTSSPITCTVAALEPGLTLTATIVVTAPLTAGAITNTATISASTPDLFPNNNRTVMVSAVSDSIPPSAVTNLTATVITTNGATLNWTPANDNVGVAGYRIYAQKPGARQQPFLVGQTIGAATTYTVTTLAAHSTYQLWVGAYDQAGNRRAVTDNASVQITTLALPVGTVQVSLEPPLPTDHDPISITVSGVYTNSCVPAYQAHERIDNLITITSTLSTESFCLPAEFPWGYTIRVGALAAGQYRVTHRLEPLVTHIDFTVTTTVTPTVPLTVPVFHMDDRVAPTAFVGIPFRYDVQASGAPTLTYTLVQAPPGMTIGAATGQIEWTPTAAMVGTASVTVRASNSLGSADYTFALTVQIGQHFFLPIVVVT